MGRNISDLIDAVEDAMDGLFLDGGRLATDEDKRAIVFAVLTAVDKFQLAEGA